MNKGEIWGPKGQKDGRGLLHVEAVDGADVLAYPRFGGFLMRIPADEFSRKFEFYPQERLDEMANSFERGLVGLDSFEEGQDIPCWLNGDKWNGWEVPFFERKDIDAALADGRIVSDERSIIEYNDEVGSYVEIMPTEGHLPENFDRRPLVEAAIKARGGDEVELANGTTAFVSIARSRRIDTPDGQVTAYNVGDGWTWSRPPEPEAAVSP